MYRAHFNNKGSLLYKDGDRYYICPIARLLCMSIVTESRGCIGKKNRKVIDEGDQRPYFSTNQHA